MQAPRRRRTETAGARRRSVPSRVPHRNPRRRTAPSVDAPDAASLPIPDYDELSASQVVERLDGLAPDELDAVRAYESAHRGRNTILGKLAQLTD